MNVEIRKDSVGQLVNLGGGFQVPSIDTRIVTTQIAVNNGDTAVIGGIYVSNQQSTNDRTPGLHKLPLLGWLFKRQTMTDQSRELLIFITPRIIKI